MFVHGVEVEAEAKARIGTARESPSEGCSRVPPPPPPPLPPQPPPPPTTLPPPPVSTASSTPPRLPATRPKRK
ncbi:hypothetical protein E2C01_092273 [Portunus trituberculatus]|uniref:Uncharacterized protein n=1 Tax=Portunus trituberculatus TaxID=210409 RepID=A0A5B7JV11_PORTR|nr:hypothetical protein [Portunus trituberculatus]